LKGISESEIISEKPVKLFVPGPKCEICDLLEHGECMARKKNPEKCTKPLSFQYRCPKCGIVKTGKRKWGECFIKFQCKNLIAGQWLCDCRFSLTFRTGDSEEAASKAKWLRGEGSEWSTDGIRWL